MDTDALNLPEDIDALKALIASQARQHRAELAHKDERIAGLEEHIKLLLAQRFGASSEKVSPAQLGLFNEAELEAPTQPEPDTLSAPAHERTRGTRKPLPSSFERVDVIHDLDESDKRCAHHGVALEHFGEDTSEQFEIIPATMRVLVHRRLKYR